MNVVVAIYLRFFIIFLSMVFDNKQNIIQMNARSEEYSRGEIAYGLMQQNKELKREKQKLQAKLKEVTSNMQNFMLSLIQPHLQAIKNLKKVQSSLRSQLNQKQTQIINLTSQLKQRQIIIQSLKRSTQLTSTNQHIFNPQNTNQLDITDKFQSKRRSQKLSISPIKKLQLKQWNYDSEIKINKNKYGINIPRNFLSFQQTQSKLISNSRRKQQQSRLLVQNMYSLLIRKENSKNLNQNQVKVLKLLNQDKKSKEKQTSISIQEDFLNSLVKQKTQSKNIQMNRSISFIVDAVDKTHANRPKSPKKKLFQKSKGIELQTTVKITYQPVLKQARIFNILKQMREKINDDYKKKQSEIPKITKSKALIPTHKGGKVLINPVAIDKTNHPNIKSNSPQRLSFQGQLSQYKKHTTVAGLSQIESKYTQSGVF